MKLKWKPNKTQISQLWVNKNTNYQSTKKGEKMTDDLISRKILIEKLGISTECVDCQHKLNGLCLWKPNMVDVCEVITEMPSAQPEIIRCKDCKHWGIHKWLNIPWCREMHIDRGAEDFCSMAERREDGKGKDSDLSS